MHRYLKRISEEKRRVFWVKGTLTILLLLGLCIYIKIKNKIKGWKKGKGKVIGVSHVKRAFSFQFVGFLLFV